MVFCFILRKNEENTWRVSSCVLYEIMVSGIISLWVLHEFKKTPVNSMNLPWMANLGESHD